MTKVRPTRAGTAVQAHWIGEYFVAARTVCGHAALEDDWDNGPATRPVDGPHAWDAASRFDGHVFTTSLRLRLLDLAGSVYICSPFSDYTDRGTLGGA